MKNLLLLSLVGILSACASDYERRWDQYAHIKNINDPKVRLSLLEKMKVEYCQKNFSDDACATVMTNIAAIEIFKTQQYDLAIQNAQIALQYKVNEWNKYYSTGYTHGHPDPRQKMSYDCDGFWNTHSSFDDNEKKNIPSTLPMIYYLALKGAKDPKAKDNLNMAYLCELDYTYEPLKEEQLLQDYMMNSMQMQDTTNQIYVKRFINEIYKPIQQSKNKFYKRTEGGTAKKMVLYENALIYAKKIGLPKIYQDYLNYNIYLNSSVY